MRRKMRLIAVTGLVFMLTFVLAGGAVAAGKPEPAGELRWTGVVAFDDAVVNEAAREAIIKGVGGVTNMTLEALDMAIVLLPDTEAVRRVEKEKGVLWVEEDSYRYYHLQPLPWGIDRIDAKEAWAGNTGDGVNVAVLDTGIDTDHPDLEANLEGGYSCVNKDTSNVEDKNGHGTHCSGIIAALNNEIGVVGVGPDIDLYAVQISRGAVIRLTDILEGIDWCIGTLSDLDDTNDIQVMSMSFGGGYSPSEDKALQDAYNDGIVLVSSAGNEYGGAVTYPAALDTVIAVSATDKSDDIAWFSSTGPEVELAAPGVSIYSTYKNGGYETLSGTSMAGPHVAGVAALVIGTGNITDTSSSYGIADEVRAVLRATAEDIGLTSDKQGYGLVDAEKAVLGTTDGDDLPAVEAHDVAVTAIDAPAQVVQGTLVYVDVTVANEGTYEETFDVVLTESPDGFSDTKAVTLEANASTTVSFSWQTSTSTALGDHTLTATAGPVTDETDTDDNSKTAIVKVVEEAAVTVTSIEPNTMQAGTTVEVTIKGSGFIDGADVTFENGSGPAPTASNVSVSADGTTITATVTAKSGGPPRDRVWDVRVTNPDGSSGVLADGFTVTP